MLVFLVHHGDAVGPEVDPQRPLSAAGRAHVVRLAAAAAARGARPEAIWHSGKLRARQTAEAFWRACNPLAEMAARHGLQPTDPPSWACDLLVGESRDVMLVGHMPNLTRVLRVLVAGSESAEMEVPAHGIVALEGEGQSWVERWRES